LRLNTRARYTLQLMVSVAHLSRNQEPISLDKVAQRARLSRRYLEQLASVLRGKSLLRSVPGRSGGYALARPAKTISVGEIIEASIGPITIVECVERPEKCMAAEVCACRPFYQLLNQRVSAMLNDYTLADLVDEGWRARARRELEGIASEPIPRSRRTSRPQRALDHPGGKT
jgi:Rrf2 family cysteine metabolism transcriptional repressor